MWLGEKERLKVRVREKERVKERKLAKRRKIEMDRDESQYINIRMNAKCSDLAFRPFSYSS